MITYLLSILFALFSSIVMTYLTIATPIGPWMGPTLALFSLAFFSCVKDKSASRMILPVLAGSVGGIIATAVGFSYGTIFFVDKDYFNALQQQPIQFFVALFSLIAAATCVGHIVACYARTSFLEKEKLAFPIGMLQWDIVSAGKDANRFKALCFGGALTTVYVGLQKLKYLSNSLKIFAERSIGIVTIPKLIFDLSQFPMLVAIGFVAGGDITIPLLVGMLSNIFLVEPLRNLFFMDMSISNVMFSFCSGIVIVGALQSIRDLIRRQT
jgi:hypothetical protein